MLDFFFIYGALPSNIEKGAYDLPLVVLSYAVASFASYTALSLVQQLVGASKASEKRLFHWGGAFAMGAGIWSMHFIGMLSYKMRMVVMYDPYLTLLSMLIAIAVAYGVFAIVARPKLSTWQILSGGVVLGFGICGMHYTGMAAMQMDGDLRYKPAIFLLSVGIAIAASIAALWMAFHLARHGSKYRTVFQLIAALIMGAAICGMHYTGMWASVMIPFADCRYDPNQNFTTLALVIGAITAGILGIALAVGIYRKEQAEQRLQSSEARLRAMIDNAMDAVIALDQDGRITEWNKQAEIIFGWTHEQAIGQLLSSLIIPAEHVNPQDMERFITQGGSLLNRRVEMIALNRKGEHFPVELAVTSYKLKSNYHYTAFLRDISERRRIELRLQTTLDEVIAAKRTAEDAQRRAEQANRAKSEFLANMSHEIRTPLNTIIGTSELLSSTTLNTEQGRYVDSLNAAGDMLLALINNILDFSKIESGAIDIAHSPLSVRELLEEVEQVISAQARRNAITLRILSPDGLPTVLGDAVRVKQVLLNLAGNAVKFNEGGTVRVRADFMRKEENKIWLRFSVEDTGKGIPPDKLDVIFEKFTQLDEFSTKKYAGTGLGLAICKRLVEMMGGSIGVKSEVGKGSLFWFDLSFEVAAGESLEDRTFEIAEESSAPAKKKEKITARFQNHVLLVEDYPPNRQMAKTMLEQLGCNVDVAQNGEEALDLMAQQSYDLVFMDCQMPEMDGFQTTAEIRKREKDKHTIIIAVTAHVLSGDKERCLQKGMDGYISKPIRSAELSKVLERYL